MIVGVVKRLERLERDAQELSCSTCKGIEQLTFFVGREPEGIPFCTECGRRFRVFIVLDPYSAGVRAP
jgi:hypothetical protein